MFTYLYMQRQNQLRSLQLELPKLSQELYAIREENIKLLYEIERFENPRHLMQLARSSEYSHLKAPFAQEILALQEGIALPYPEKVFADSFSHKPSAIVGATK